MKKHKLLILALAVLLGTGLSFGQDHGDFPDNYVDESVAPGGVGSLLDPYSDFSEINWTTGGDNSIFDYLAGAPSQSPRVLLQEGEEWRETLTVGTSGTATYPIIIGSYGSGADSIINGSDIITTWTTYDTSVSDWSAALDTDYANSMYYNVRQILPNAGLSRTGTQIRIHITAHSANGTVVSGTSIGVRSGSTDDFTATPTRITWDSGSAGTTIAAGNSAWSDWVAYSPTPGTDQLVHFYGVDTSDYRYVPAGGDSYRSTESADNTLTQTVNYGAATNPMTRVIDDYEVRTDNTWQNAIGATEPLIVWMDDTELTEGSGKDALADHEWVFDTNVLYLRDDTGDPDGSGVEIEAGQRVQGIKIQDKDYITIDGLDCQKANYWGIYVYQDSSYITTTNCMLNTNRVHGIRHNTVTYCTVTSTIAHSNGLQGISFNIDCTPGCSASDCTSYSNGEEGFGAEAGSDDVTFTDCVAYQNGKSGFSTSDVTGIVYLRCVSYENGQIIAASGNGFGLWDDESVGSQAYYYYCIAYKNVANGLRINHALTGGSTSRAYNCVFYANEAYNVWIDDDTLDMKNCILMDAGYNKEIQSGTGFSPILSNNCYYDSDASTVCRFDGTDYTSKATWEAASGETNSVWADPLMTDPANDDFTINPHSPCVDAGTDVSLTEDYLGLKIRHAPDIGAYENQANALFHSVIVTLRIIENIGRLLWP